MSSISEHLYSKQNSCLKWVQHRRVSLQNNFYTEKTYIPTLARTLISAMCYSLYYVQWFEVRGDCWYCWYWWNCWPSLFKLSLEVIVDIGGIVDHFCLNFPFINNVHRFLLLSVGYLVTFWTLNLVICSIYTILTFILVI